MYLISSSIYCSVSCRLIPEDGLILIRDSVRIIRHIRIFRVCAALTVYIKVCSKGGILRISLGLQLSHSLREVLSGSINGPVVKCVSFRCTYGYICLRTDRHSGSFRVLTVFFKRIYLVSLSAYCTVSCRYILEDGLILIRDSVRIIRYVIIRILGVGSALGICIKVYRKCSIIRICICLKNGHLFCEILLASINCPIIKCIFFIRMNGYFCVRACRCLGNIIAIVIFKGMCLIRFSADGSISGRYVLKYDLVHIRDAILFIRNRIRGVLRICCSRIAFLI